MARGDQIYVMRPLAGVDSLYQHHGIDCGDGSVIHYYKPPGDAVVTRTSYEIFARENPVYTKQVNPSYVPDIVIERAESRLGERQYNLLTNNCEHFASWCKTGQSQCVQLAGIDVGLLKGYEQRFEEAAAGNPVAAMEQLKLALGNVSIAQLEIQAQLTQAQKELDTWQRAAQLALKQGKESLARAALERRYPFKKKVADLQRQLDEARELQQAIENDRQRLKSNIS
jgi:Lecithin retinol acyltransferase